MPRITGTTDTQTKFLRSFRTSPFGPGVEDWPSAAILRRWLRKPAFVAALRSLQTAMRCQADFQLLSAAAAGAHVLHTSITAGNSDDSHKQIKAMSGLLKLAHLREKFASQSLPKPVIRDNQLINMLGKVHPETTVGFFLEYIGVPGRGQDNDGEKSAA
jgi:hypothetical protein